MKPCETCGEMFHRPDHPQQRFCSRQCRGRGLSGERHGRWSGGRLETERRHRKKKLAWCADTGTCTKCFKQPARPGLKRCEACADREWAYKQWKASSKPRSTGQSPVRPVRVVRYPSCPNGGDSGVPFPAPVPAVYHGDEFLVVWSGGLLLPPRPTINVLAQVR